MLAALRKTNGKRSFESFPSDQRRPILRVKKSRMAKCSESSAADSSSDAVAVKLGTSKEIARNKTLRQCATFTCTLKYVRH